MKSNDSIKTYQLKLNERCKHLVEQGYNLHQIDSALSDIAEYKAIKVLDELNRLKYLYREIPKNC